MIDLVNVSKIYGDKVALSGANLHIEDGEFVFVVGPTAAGKSTFIKLISKEIEPDEGQLYVDGMCLSKLSAREVPYLRRHIGMVFQDYKLLPNKTVYENVAFAMEVVHHTQRAIRRQVPQVLAVIGMSEDADKFPHELSGGQQQRVAIARAIINNPKILIADEPTGNLDPATSKEIMKLLDQINRRGTTVVMVTHDNAIVNSMSKRVVAIEGGKIVSDKKGGNYNYV